MQLWRLAFLFALMLPAVFSAAVNLQFAVPAIAIIVVIFLAAMNMLAHSISNPQLEAWAKTEIREFLAGLIIIAIVIGILVGSNGLAVVLTGHNDYITKAQSVVDSWGDGLTGAYHDVITAASYIRVAASYSSGTNIPIWWVSLSYQTAPLSGASIYLVPLSLATQGLSNAIFLAEAIRLLISFFGVVIPQILLPMAFCARLIPFTRRVGNTLIAICVGVVLFLPLSVIIADMVNGQIGLTAPALSDPDSLDSNPFPIYAIGWACEAAPIRILFSLTDPLFALILCLPIAWIPGAFPVCFDLLWHVVYPIISLIFQIVNAVTLIAWEAFINPGKYGGTVFDHLQPFMRDVSNYVMVIYMDIVLIAIITMSSIRSLSAALGGEWYMAGIQRLI
ncbi:MAG: hypothetical protein U0R44_03190 [Candidatus Micrarchaeia archaeon]